MRNAITESTRRTYAAPLASYQRFCTRRGTSELIAAVTSVKAGDWLAELALGGHLSGATIRTHRSALSTAWEESGIEGPNPLHAATIDRIVRGAAKMLVTRDLAARATREITIELTPTLLSQFLPYVTEAPYAGPRHPDPSPGLYWAAACLGVFGLLRPNEFLYVGQRQKVLLASAITFRASALHDGERALLPRGVIITEASIPDRLEVALGATKADHLARNGTHVIAARMAVEALWRWMHQRRDAGYIPDAPLFVHGDGLALASRKLLTQVSVWYARLTGVVPKLTGRAFRRGGASAMLQEGASIPDIMAAGRWRSPAMVGVYTSKEAKRAQATAASRTLNPPPLPSPHADAANWSGVAHCHQ